MQNNNQLHNKICLIRKILTNYMFNVKLVVKNYKSGIYTLREAIGLIANDTLAVAVVAVRLVLFGKLTFWEAFEYVWS